MKGFVAERTLERLVPGVREPVALVVALLVEAFAADLADERLDALVDASMSVERRGPVERLAARQTAMRLLRRVNDLVTTQRRRLAEAFATYLKGKR